MVRQGQCSVSSALSVSHTSSGCSPGGEAWSAAPSRRGPPDWYLRTLAPAALVYSGDTAMGFTSKLEVSVLGLGKRIRT